MKTTNSFTSFSHQKHEDENRNDLKQGIMKRLLEKYSLKKDLVKIKIDNNNSISKKVG